MAAREKLVVRIQKLLALASSNSSAAEAETALLQARKLMAEHEVTETDLEEEKDSVGQDTLDEGGRMDDLKASVLIAIAYAHRCSVLKSRHWNKEALKCQSSINVVGFSRDRAVVKALYDWAWSTVNREAQTFIAGEKARIKKNGYAFTRSDYSELRRGFILGFSSGLQAAYSKQAQANPQWAMVLATPIEVKEYMNDQTNGKSFKSRRSEVDARAFGKGHEAGTEHVKNTSQRDVPQLEALPKQLAANNG